MSSSLIWTFPAIMIASIAIGWAAEAAAIYISAGMALAILAFLQTLPEFGVEAFVAWSGDTNLMLANLTGSLRLFVGLGWPMIYFIHAFSSWRGSKYRSIPKEIKLPGTFCVEATFLLLPIFYFLYVDQKNYLSLADGMVLSSFYVFYLLLLNTYRKRSKELGLDSGHEANAGHHEEEGDLDAVPAAIVRLPKRLQWPAILSLFVMGGLVLYFAVHPFVDGLKELAVSWGMSEFVFIQWVAPFASEFPEKVTAFNWARKASKVPMAIFNMVSSSVNQWTLLAGFVPIIYSVSMGRYSIIPLSEFQHTELLLTVVQSALGALFLADLRFRWFEAVGLFALWLVQFLVPSVREEILTIYGAALVLQFGVVFWGILVNRRFPKAWVGFSKMVLRS